MKGEKTNRGEKTYEMTIKPLYRKICGFFTNEITFFLWKSPLDIQGYLDRGHEIRTKKLVQMMMTKFNLPFPTVLEHDHRVLHHISFLNSIYLSGPPLH